MFETGKARGGDHRRGRPRANHDTGAIEKIAREVVAKSPDNVAKYRAGNEGVFKFFVGQVMRETRGQANPQAVNDILKRTRLAEADQAAGRLLKEKVTRRRHFACTADDGTEVALADFRGKNLILYFFPKANTPG